MKAIIPGTRYEIRNFNDPESSPQSIQFVEKAKDGTFTDGTTNEEIINVLIDRMYHLQSKRSSVENAVVIELLKNVRRLFSKRLNKKIERIKEYEETH